MKTLTKIETIGALVMALAGCGDQVATSPRQIEREEGCRQAITRYSRITICDRGDEGQEWTSEPHDRYHFFLGRSHTRYFPDGRISLHQYKNGLTFEWSADGERTTTMTDRLGNRYRLEEMTEQRAPK